jgi:hypothetical protein
MMIPTNLPYVHEVVAYLADARFQDSMRVIGTAHNIHNLVLVPAPLRPEAEIFDYYPPLRAIAQAGRLTIAPEVLTFINQLPSLGGAPVTADDRVQAIERLARAYRHALIKRTDRMPVPATRLDAPFPPMTTAVYQQRTAFVVERAITIPVEQTIDWWADVTCGVALTSPSDAALAQLAADNPQHGPPYPVIDGWRQVGYIVENLTR